MNTVGQRESRTQRRVIAFFEGTLGYGYLGRWKDREANENVEETLLRSWLKSNGESDKLIAMAVEKLRRAARVGGSKTLYDANREVYGLLRYGAKVRPELGESTETVWLIDWNDPSNNDFAIAEEVTVKGERDKRPDLVLYVNGIAVGVLELKRSTVSVAQGIRQNLDSQKKEFIRDFFATVQLVMAGNETEGLRYGVVETPEKYWLRWKEADAHPSVGTNPLLRELGQTCSRERLLELVHDFIVFDAGTKKICRHNQYFGVRAAQANAHRREGGVLWHTQGSGKSLIMVWLAKWLRENVDNARVLIITDRRELDEQIEKVFKGVREDIRRTKSGADLVEVLNASEEWLVCSLMQKFRTSDEGDVDVWLADLRSHLPSDFHAKGEIFIFVDECHRTQSGKLHDAMTALLPGALLIGFTGTPLLKSDKKRSIETFGPYIHTYKYDEAVEDGVVLDLRYEARDIDQNITSQAKVDQWFDAKTRGLSDIGKAELKKRWGTMQNVLSARDRLEKIVADILMDMETRDRLRSGHGNALLVSDSIYSACRFFEMFQRTPLAGKCAIVTSYRPHPSDVKGEESGEGLTDRLQEHKVYREMLAAHFDEPEDAAMKKVEAFEKDVKKRFVEQPAQMKLLIVVDKLLTGFDAPPATYLYIDKPMQDHGLFQAICRVNRLDGEDKEYGYVVDYKDLFKSLERAIDDYTGEAFAGYDAEDVQGLLKDRLKLGRERLEEAREAVKRLCEPVEPPCDTNAYRRYFCAEESGNAEQLAQNETKRITLYRLVAAYLRAYANLANEMQQAGYSDAAAAEVRREVRDYENVRQEVKLTSGDYVDMKRFESAMRHLLDAYIRAEESENVSAFDDLTLVQMIVERGGAEAIESLPAGIRRDREGVAETIENNVRRLIVDEMAVNPRYYERMSALLDALILQRKREALNYKEYLQKIEELARNVAQPESGSSYPPTIDTPVLRAIYENLEHAAAPNVLRQPTANPHEASEITASRESFNDYGGPTRREQLSIAVERNIREVKQADWRDHTIKERQVRNAIRMAIGDDEAEVDRLFEIVKAQRDY